MGARFLVTIEDRQAERLPVQVECDSVVAFCESHGQAAFSTRGLDAARLALHVGAMLVRLYEIDPVAMAAGITMIRDGSIGTAGAGRYAATGEPVDVVQRSPKLVGAECAELIRLALDFPLPAKGT